MLEQLLDAPAAAAVAREKPQVALLRVREELIQALGARRQVDACEVHNVAVRLVALLRMPLRLGQQVGQQRERVLERGALCLPPAAPELLQNVLRHVGHEEPHRPLLVCGVRVLLQDAPRPKIGLQQVPETHGVELHEYGLVPLAP